MILARLAQTEIDGVGTQRSPCTIFLCRLGSEGEAESLLEEIRALNRTIARFTSADENPELIKQLFDRVVTVRCC
jgi:hypothetical protein